eukprot:m.25287 g.25287  ORF g.25287 m.25287 type:complete len:50 (-) comp8846_c0_seq3:656-805(-)
MRVCLCEGVGACQKINEQGPAYRGHEGVHRGAVSAPGSLGTCRWPRDSR